MSNPEAKVRNSKAKDKRQEPVLDLPTPPSKSKKSKPIVMEYRWADRALRSITAYKDTWLTFNTYRNIDEAKRTKKILERKDNYFEYRIQEHEEN